MGGRSSEAERKLAFIVDRSRDFITLISHDYRYEVVNDSYCSAMEKARDDILGKTVAQVWGRDRFHGNIKQHLDRCLAGDEIEYVDRFSFGPFERHMQVTLLPYHGNGQEVTHVLVFTRDVTRFSQIESKLSAYEFRDLTTGLFNRRSLDIILEKEIDLAHLPRQTGIRAILFISLRGFNEVNRMYGHHFGDLLLEDTALRVKGCLRPADYVFRFDGTNLAVLCTEITRKSSAAELARRIGEAIRVPYQFQNNFLALSSAIGVSLFPDDGDKGEALIQNATSASIEASNQGAPFFMYNRKLHDEAVSRMKLVSDLHRAFDGGQFELYYQPIVQSEGRIAGAEALIRWNHPGMGLLQPAQFVGLAEEVGLVQLLDRWVLFNAAKQLAAWSAHNRFYVSVNLSAAEFSQPELADLVSGAIRSAGGLDPGRLKLEITESQCMADPEAAIDQMTRLNALSVDLWIDDFGTGHSSLNYLKRFPSRMVKLEHTFINELDDSPEDIVYVSTILNSVRSRGKEMVVEGVESASQYRILRRIGCTAMQGYYFSRPVSAAEFTRMIEADKPLPL